MSSKSQNLVKLCNRLVHFTIPHFMIYAVDADNKDLDSFILSVIKEFSGCKICIRSAAADEDGVQSSGAGEYDSVQMTLKRYVQDSIRSLLAILVKV